MALPPRRGHSYIAGIVGRLIWSWFDSGNRYKTR
jgi:hypothetical protein